LNNALHPNACPETYRPSWLTGPRPHRSMPITSSAACLPFTAIGTVVLQISISARDTQLPPQMPDIRLQANSCPPIIDQSLLAGGVHIRLVRQCRHLYGALRLTLSIADEPEKDTASLKHRNRGRNLRYETPLAGTTRASLVLRRINSASSATTVRNCFLPTTYPDRRIRI
jgi:hypothetical protein